MRPKSDLLRHEISQAHRALLLIFSLFVVALDGPRSLWAQTARSALSGPSPSVSPAALKKIAIHKVGPTTSRNSAKAVRNKSKRVFPIATFSGTRINSGLVSSIAPEAVAWAYCTDSDGSIMNDCIAIYTLVDDSLVENIITTTVCGIAAIQKNDIFADNPRRAPVDVGEDSRSITKHRIKNPARSQNEESLPNLIRITNINSTTKNANHSAWGSGNGCFHNYLLVRKTTYTTSVWAGEQRETVIKIDSVVEIPSRNTASNTTDLKKVMTGTTQVVAASSSWGVSGTFLDADGVVIYNEGYFAIASESNSVDCDQYADLAASAVKALGDVHASAVSSAIIIGIALYGAAEVGGVGSAAGPLGTVAGVAVGGAVGGKIGDAVADFTKTGITSAYTIAAAVVKIAVNKLCQDLTTPLTDLPIPVAKETTLPGMGMGGSGMSDSGGCPAGMTGSVVQQCIVEKSWYCPSEGECVVSEKTLSCSYVVECK